MRYLKTPFSGAVGHSVSGTLLLQLLPKSCIMKYLFYPLALGLLMLGGCSKDREEATLVLAGEYQANSTIVTAPITMYTSTGVVNNQAVVDGYLRRQALSAAYFSRTDLPTPAANSLAIIIRQNKQVNFISSYPTRTDTVKAEITSQLAKYVVLSNRDSVAGFSSASAANRCAQLSAQMPIEKPVKRCVGMSPASGYSQYCKYRPVEVVAINAGQLYIPLLSWSLKSSPSVYSNCGSASYGSWNLFNKAVLNQLASGDTLVMQERSIALTKK